MVLDDVHDSAFDIQTQRVEAKDAAAEGPSKASPLAVKPNCTNVKLEKR